MAHTFVESAGAAPVIDRRSMLVGTGLSLAAAAGLATEGAHAALPTPGASATPPVAADDPAGAGRHVCHRHARMGVGADTPGDTWSTCDHHCTRQLDDHRGSGALAEELGRAWEAAIGRGEHPWPSTHC